MFVPADTTDMKLASNNPETISNADENLSNAIVVFAEHNLITPLINNVVNTENTVINTQDAPADVNQLHSVEPILGSFSETSFLLDVSSLVPKRKFVSGQGKRKPKS